MSQHAVRDAQDSGTFNRQSGVHDYFWKIVERS